MTAKHDAEIAASLDIWELRKRDRDICGGIAIDVDGTVYMSGQCPLPLLFMTPEAE